MAEDADTAPSAIENLDHIRGLLADRERTIVELRRKLRARGEELDLTYNSLAVEKDRYGQAIRVLHHGVRHCIAGAQVGDLDGVGIRILQLLEVDQRVLASLMSMAIGIGYAYALEVMTRRAAPDHVRSAIDHWIASQGADPEEVKKAAADEPAFRMYEHAMRMFPQPPHVAYEEARDGNSR